MRAVLRLSSGVIHVGVYWISATARSGVLSSRYSSADAVQVISHPCRRSHRLAHGVPEGSKRSHPKRNQTATKNTTALTIKLRRMHRGVGWRANEMLPGGSL